VGVLQADGEAQQVLGSLCFWALHRGAMLDQALWSTQTRCPCEELRPRCDCQGTVASPAHFNRDHSSRSSHLTQCEVMARMRLQARIVDNCDGGMSAEEGCYLQGILRVGVHAVWNSADAAQHQPAVERSRHGTACSLHATHTRKEVVLGSCHNGAAKYV